MSDHKYVAVDGSTWVIDPGDWMSYYEHDPHALELRNLMADKASDIGEEELASIVISATQERYKAFREMGMSRQEAIDASVATNEYAIVSKVNEVVRNFMSEDRIEEIVLDMLKNNIRKITIAYLGLEERYGGMEFSRRIRDDIEYRVKQAVDKWLGEMGLPENASIEGMVAQHEIDKIVKEAREEARREFMRMAKQSIANEIAKDLGRLAAEHAAKILSEIKK